FQYHIHVPPNIQSGTYTIYVTSSYLITTTTSGVTTTSAASSSNPISFYVTGAPNIVLTANPSTSIVPGSQSSVQLTAFNSGTASATNVSITVLNTPNFTVSGSPLFTLGTISGGSSSSAAATLQANSTMSPGINHIPVRLQYTTQYGANFTKNVSIPISVIVNAPNLQPSITSAQPQTLYAGSNQTLTVSIQNIGIGVAKNVTVRFLSTPNITVGSSASSLFIGTINAGSSSSQNLFITASKDANQSYYRIPVELSYSNANYQSSVQKVSYINVTMQKAAIFNITGVSSGALVPGATYVPITFRVRNIGSQTAQQVTFTLQSIYPVAPSSPNAYLTALAPGQSANVTFYVNVDAQGNPGSYPATVYEQWSQPSGAASQQYSGAQNYYAQVGGTKSGGGQGGGIATAVGVTVAIAVVVAFLVRSGRIKLPPRPQQKKK
ncbi:MAG: hypothetical protein KGH59_04510, partial [Candidatus Micrarchaeota archaeon]|nr:hypothetical protein [Candidatus Micrarchaeota archaeon]